MQELDDPRHNPFHPGPGQRMPAPFEPGQFLPDSVPPQRLHQAIHLLGRYGIVLPPLQNQHRFRPAPHLHHR